MKQKNKRIDFITGGTESEDNYVDADFLNQAQEELENVVRASGFAFDENNEQQVAQAITDHALGASYAEDTGTANNYILSITGSRQTPPVLVKGYRLFFQTGNVNTSTTPTLNYAGLGVKTVVAENGSDAIVAGDIKVGVYNEVVYNGTNWCLILSNPYHIGDFKQSSQQGNHGRWLLCNGQTVSRTTYSALFALIGTAFGVGNGTTTFTLPDCQGRVAGSIGSGSGLTTRAAGQLVGAETHTLTSNEVGYNTWSFTKDDGDGQIAARASIEKVTIDGTVIVPLNSPDQTYTANISPKNQTPHNIMQPTIFLGNTFIYAGV